MGRKSLWGSVSLGSDVYKPGVGGHVSQTRSAPLALRPLRHQELPLEDSCAPYPASTELLASSGSQAKSEAKQRQGAEERESSLYIMGASQKPVK